MRGKLKMKVAFTKLAYFLIFASFVLFQLTNLIDISSYANGEFVNNVDVLFGYFVLVLLLPVAIAVIIYFPALFVVNVKVSFNLNLPIFSLDYKEIKKVVIQYIKTHRQSSLQVFRC